MTGEMREYCEMKGNAMQLTKTMTEKVHPTPRSSSKPRCRTWWEGPRLGLQIRPPVTGSALQQDPQVTSVFEKCRKCCVVQSGLKLNNVSRVGEMIRVIVIQTLPNPPTHLSSVHGAYLPQARLQPLPSAPTTCHSLLSCLQGSPEHVISTFPPVLITQAPLPRSDLCTSPWGSPSPT